MPKYVKAQVVMDTHNPNVDRPILYDLTRGLGLEPKTLKYPIRHQPPPRPDFYVMRSKQKCVPRLAVCKLCVQAHWQAEPEDEEVLVELRA